MSNVTDPITHSKLSVNWEKITTLNTFKFRSEVLKQNKYYQKSSTNTWGRTLL